MYRMKFLPMTVIYVNILLSHITKPMNIFDRTTPIRNMQSLLPFYMNLQTRYRSPNGKRKERHLQIHFQNNETQSITNCI